MQKLETSLPGVLEIHPKVFRDARGFFMETYHREKFAALGIDDSFVQDNHSCSTKGTLRGLHYQLHHPQAKLCRVIEGEALDVAVDIRLGSPHFGKWTSVWLSAQSAESDLHSGRICSWLSGTDGERSVSLQVQRFLRSGGRTWRRLE